MKVIDPKSMLIGILITLLVFSTLGLRPKTDELGHLVVRSLTIEDDRGVIMGYLGNILGPATILKLYIPVILLYIYNITVIILNTLKVFKNKKHRYIPALKIFK